MPSITAGWEASRYFGKAPLVIQFSDLSEVDDTEITSWLWDFGDGNTSTQQNPTHIYTEAGLYTVSLTVGDGDISDEAEYEDVIEVFSLDSLPQLSIEVPLVADSIVDNVLRWKAYGLADENTDYKIQSDAGATGDFQDVDTVDATERDESSGIYYPYLGSLVSAIGREDILVIYTGMAIALSNNQRIRIDGETILTGKGDVGGEVFQNCTRGADNTVRRPHDQYTAVAHMHESHTDEGVDFGNRHVIRYHLSTITSLGETLAVESLAVKPSLPPTEDFCTVWGVAQDSVNQPIVGLPVRLSIVGNDVYNKRTGEVFSPDEVQSTLSDADGYWQVVAPRSVVLSQPTSSAVKLSIGDRDIFLSEVPDVGAINYLECI